MTMALPSAGAHRADLNTTTISALWQKYGDKFTLLGYTQELA